MIQTKKNPDGQAGAGQVASRKLMQPALQPTSGPLPFDHGHLLVRNEFAELNGWSRSAHLLCGEFTIDQLAHGRVGGRFGRGLPSKLPFDSGEFDHPLYFKRGRIAACLVLQPYPPFDRDRCSKLVERLGLMLHMPPNEFASIHYPGATYFVALTAAGATVRWLPFQCEGGGS
jgi:hypothetical protein